MDYIYYYFYYNYLQLLYRIVNGILLYQGVSRPILPTKHSEIKIQNLFHENFAGFYYT